MKPLPCIDVEDRGLDICPVFSDKLDRVATEAREKMVYIDRAPEITIYYYFF